MLNCNGISVCQIWQQETIVPECADNCGMVFFNRRIASCHCCMSHLAYLRGIIGAAFSRLTQQTFLACLNWTQVPSGGQPGSLLCVIPPDPVPTADIGSSIQGSRHDGQPAEMLHMQQELAAAHKLVAHLKIELDAAHGRLDIFRLQPLLLYYPINTRLSMSYE